MAQVLGLRPLPGTPSFIRCSSSQNRVIKSTQSHLVNTSWAQVQQSVQSHGRFFCLFSDGSKQERARKALEGNTTGNSHYSWYHYHLSDSFDVAVIFNPLLFALRGTRNGLTYLSSKIMNVVNPSISRPSTIAQDHVAAPISAKETVVRKWGSN
ncbi:hypothetical protein Leryth_019658 [Lithospermum erythrorhizon]|nr:hypothetical protein Leryth_019658 [Lithospermum erythrorhizon]